jgi:hypothetical protein
VTKQYLRTWYDGEDWSNYVDAIIGITAQETTDNVAGLSPGDVYLDAGRIFTLLKWQAYWADDNLVQHEVATSIMWMTIMPLVASWLLISIFRHSFGKMLFGQFSMT